jgi:hypothetical protein
MGEIVSSIIGGNASKRAAQTQADAQVKAAQVAADAARFKPVGMTTAFGSSNFGFDPVTGNLNSAGYALTPQMQAQRDAFLGQAAGSGMNIAAQAGQAGQGLFNLGQGYLAQSPEAAAQQYLQAQQAALAPGQERQLAGIRNNQFQRGTSGLSVGATEAGGMGASNPELQAYYNSIAQTNLGLQAQAQQEGRAQTQFGAGLLGSGIDLTSQGYNPYKTQFGLGQSIEEAGQGAFNMSSALGGRQAVAGAQVGNTLFAGGNNAAASIYKGANNTLGNAVGSLANNPTLNNAVSGLFNRAPPPSYMSQVGGGGGFGTGNAFANVDLGTFL